MTSSIPLAGLRRPPASTMNFPGTRSAEAAALRSHSLNRGTPCGMKRHREEASFTSERRKSTQAGSAARRSAGPVCHTRAVERGAG